MYNKYNMKLAKAYLEIAVVIIYIVFLYIDFANILSCAHLSLQLKFVGVVLCFLIALLIGKNGYDFKDTSLLKLALLLTIIADFNLLILGKFEVGVFIFCLAQLFHTVRHCRAIELKAFVFVLQLALISVLFSLSLFIRPENIPQNLYILALIYSFLLLVNVFTAMIAAHNSFYTMRTKFLLASGFILFLLCDINVALYNILPLNSMDALSGFSLKYLAGKLIWLFYMPSQLFLALSGYKTS